jgi:predicted RNase H-like HicB family nuclease
MARRFYPAVIVQDTGDGQHDGTGVIFADFPGCVSGLDTIQQAAAMGAEALSGPIEATVRDNDQVPEPSDPGLLPD